MCRPELAGGSKLRVGDIDGDDRLRTLDDRALKAVQTDTANPDDRDAAVRFDAGDVGAIGEGLQDLQLQLGSPALAGIDELRLTTGLERIFDRYLQQRGLTISILSLALTGMIALALGVAALLGALTASRRRAATALARSRGASGRQLGGAQLVEGVIWLVPFAVFGYPLQCAGPEDDHAAFCLHQHTDKLIVVQIMFDYRDACIGRDHFNIAQVLPFHFIYDNMFTE